MATLTANVILSSINTADPTNFFDDSAPTPQAVTFDQNDVTSMVAGQGSAASVKETWRPPTYNTTSDDSYATMSAAAKAVFDANCKTIIKLKRQEGDVYPRILISNQEIAAINGTVN